MKTVTITSFYKIQCALKNKRFSTLFWIGSSRKHVKYVSYLQRPHFSFVSTIVNILPKLNVIKTHALLLL